ncbi:MAG: hypothetical protein JST59_00490 [Actinobacteria bacterium]|nr:hypothetical protein [Actinomycetota bacterium]
MLTTDREKLADNCVKLVRSINMTVDRIIDEEQKPDPNQHIQLDVLSSFFPLFIIGRNQRVEQLEPLDLSVGDARIVISAKVHYTFFRRSLPTGTNNLGLPKETFNTFNLPPDKEREYLDLAKYFTYNSVSTLLEKTDKSPDVEPTVITLTIDTNVELWLALSHPTFNHELNLAEGKSQVNVPYTNQPIHSWLYIRSSAVAKAPLSKESQVPAAMQT